MRVVSPSPEAYSYTRILGIIGMKIRLGELRKIIREAVGVGEGLAALVTEDLGGFKATVYYSVPVEKMFRKSSGDVIHQSPELMAKLVANVVGRVQVIEPMEPCWDAMMVASIAGPGKLMYGVAYALSPSGLLISDRDSMTSQAVAAWRNMAAKGTRGKKKLDDINPPHETPEPEDDCVLRPEGFLNYAYEAEGWEMGTLETMRDEHESLVARVTKDGVLSRDEVEKALTKAGLSYFQARYREASRR